MEFETLIYSKSDHIAKILMNRPEVRNAENKQKGSKHSDPCQPIHHGTLQAD